MCASGMLGHAYSGYPGDPLSLLGMLVFFVLLATVIWLMLHSQYGKRILAIKHEPQPHDEPYAYSVPDESALEVLRERYARGGIDS